jgi:hypothetical protein
MGGLQSLHFLPPVIALPARTPGIVSAGACANGLTLSGGDFLTQALTIAFTMTVKAKPDARHHETLPKYLKQRFDDW